VLQAFLDLLNPEMRQLALSIEQEIDVEIEVVVDADMAVGDDPGTLKSDGDEHGAEIRTSAANYFPNASVYHELRHIQRALVEGVPRLIVCEDFEPWNPANYDAISDLDNNIEHLFIVPGELAKFPERRAYWEGRVGALLARLEGNHFHAVERRRFALLAWLLVNDMVGSPTLIERCRNLLQQLEFLGNAVQLRANVTAAAGAKEQVVRVVFERLELPLGLGALRRYDTEAGTHTDTPLAPGTA
jgi:hypothetical protein